MDNLSIESFIAHCDEMMIAEEGMLKRAFSKSEKNSKAKTVLSYWGNPKNLPSKEEAVKTLKNLESVKEIHPGHIPMDLVKHVAVAGYPQSKYIKLVKKMKTKDYATYMLSTSSTTYSEIPELTEKLKVKLSGITDANKINEIRRNFLIEESKKMKCVLNINHKNEVSKVSSTNKAFEKAIDFWNKNQLVCVQEDGGGNSLVYSIASGKFYDYFHESDWGENYREWLTSGVTYKDLMNHILSGDNNSTIE